MKTQTQVAVPSDANIDKGLRAYMIKVYNQMGIGMVVTGVVAYVISMLAGGDMANLTTFGKILYTNTLVSWAVILAPLALVFYMSFGFNRINADNARKLFYLFSALIGVSLSSIFLVYTGSSIARVFFITAAAFGGLSLWGYTTRRNLQAMGTFCVMGLFGLIIAMIVNIFLASSALHFAVSVIGVLVFSGLTAWDTQETKERYDPELDLESLNKIATHAALVLYLNFLNMFQFLLYLFGNRE